ncbi:MAG: hypothetical protein PVSMB3_16770 [Candidatus Dormibacteraceae bacterium]
MRPLVALSLLLLVACDTPQATAPTSTATRSASAQLACRLPVWWTENIPSPPSLQANTTFVRVPDGAVSTLMPLPDHRGGSGGTYLSASQRWIGTDRKHISPDETRYAYTTQAQANYEVHVVDIATGADRVVYSGPTLFIVIAFESDTIYVVHGVRPRQGSYENLYRLDPAGGEPALVPGSNRHMYQFAWVLVSDGAAWGIDVRIDGNVYNYSILRLDLATSQVTQWGESSPGDMFWPLGTDSKHRLYLGDNQQLLRLGSPGQVDRLPNPGPIGQAGNVGGPGGLVSDSRGVWFPGRGSVWLYTETQPPKQFVVGAPTETVWPAGPCL